LKIFQKTEKIFLIFFEFFFFNGLQLI